jgi:HipA-like protein
MTTVIRVLGPSGVRIGTLWQECTPWRTECAMFFFQYDLAYAESPNAEPISAFPHLDGIYRSVNLWPFFAARIPPLQRPDVKKLLQQRGIQPDQTLEVLGAVAQKAPTNPYELRLETVVEWR